MVFKKIYVIAKLIFVAIYLLAISHKILQTGSFQSIKIRSSNAVVFFIANVCVTLRNNKHQWLRAQGRKNLDISQTLSEIGSII